jgi:2-aminoethylphosphonate-pyruvate transaminase
MNNGIVGDIRRLFEKKATSMYGGEPVTQLEHALQTAALAEADGADAELVAAALLHDVGHLLHNSSIDAADEAVNDMHEELAHKWLAKHFPPAVTEPIRLHVAAKRYLCTRDPKYRNSLSSASQKSLQLQGGAFSTEEAIQYEQQPFSERGARLRRWDDLAKIPGRKTPELDHFLPYVAAATQSQKAPPRDKPLFTPGPLTTSSTVKAAMLRDLGSRDGEFIEVVNRLRNRLLSLAGVSQSAGYECVLMQGSGTFTVESVISSAIPPQGKLLVVVNGAYGERIVAIAKRHRIETVIVRAKENNLPDLEQVRHTLAGHAGVHMVAAVHCETTSGIMNPIREIGELAHEFGSRYFVDSMSAFGAVPLDTEACHIDFLVSSANKCIEGVPGFAFAICRREALLATEGIARTVSLDLLAQWQGLERNGQFRFTPPTHTLLAFDQALCELEAEGGVAGRARRYRENHETLARGMREMGFREYVSPSFQGNIITSFCYPNDLHFDFDEFYARLNDKGFVIYPGKVSDADCFRIGTIGRLFPHDVLALLGAIRTVLIEMNVSIPLR